MRLLAFFLCLFSAPALKAQSWIPHWQGADYNQLVQWHTGAASAYVGYENFFYQLGDHGASYSVISTDPLLKFQAMHFLDLQNGWAIKKNDAFEMFATRTGNGGQTWTTAGMIPTFDSNPIIRAWDDNLLLCASYQKMYRSTDLGQNWTQVATMPQGILGIFWKSQTEVWAASQMGLVYRSLDSGASWATVAVGISTSYPADDIRFVAPNIVLISVGGGGGIIRKSTDGGTVWTTLTPVVNNITAFEAFSDQHLMVGSLSVIKESTDGGINWNTLHTWQYSRLQGRFATSTDGLKVLTGFGGQVYKQNLDNTWTEVNAGMAYVTQMDFISDLEGWATGADHFNARVMRTQDGGITWHLANAPDGVSFSDFVTSQIGYCIAPTGFYRTSDGGQNWVLKTSEFSNYTKVEVVDALSVRLLLNNLTVKITNDGGDTWQTGTYNDPTPMAAFPFYDMEFTSPTHGFLSGDSGPSAQGTAFFTTNGGLNWSKYNNFPNGPDLPEVVYMSQTTGIYSTVNTLYKTTTSGASWSTINVPGLSGNYLAQIYFRNLTHGWASAGNTLRKTVNGGSTWTNVSEFWMADQTFGQFYHPSDNVGYMASSLGFVRWGDAPCALPAFTATLDQTTVQVCAGNTAFIGFNSATDGLAVQWFHDGQLISTNETLAITNAQPSDNGLYECHLSNANSCGTFNLVLIATLDAVTEVVPAVTASANQTGLCTGSTLVLNASVSGGTGIGYFWYRDDNSIGTGAQLTLNNAQTFMTGTYRCDVLVSTVCGTVTVSSVEFDIVVSQSFSLTVFPINPEEFLCEGTELILQSSVFGYNDIQYTWILNGQPVGTGPTLVIDAITLNQQGQYTLDISAANGCTSQNFQQTVDVFVFPLPQIVAPTPNQVLSLCLGADAVLTYNGTTVEGTEMYLNWLKDGIYIAFGPEVILNSMTTADFGEYYCEVTYFSACGDAVQTFLVYTINEGTGGPNISPENSDINLSICQGQSVELSFSAATTLDSYEWTFNGETVGTGPFLNIANFGPSQVGEYYCTVSATNTCGTSEGSFLMFTLEINADELTISGPAQPAQYSICTGAPFVLAFDSLEPLDSYLWTLNGTPVGSEAVLAVDAASSSDAGLYSCTVTASNSCTTAEAVFDMALLTITALPIITPPLPPTDLVVCAGEDAAITYSPAEGISSFFWTGPGIFTSEDNPLVLTNVDASDSGVYSCSVTSTNTCGTSEGTFEVVNLSVSAIEVPVISANGSTLSLQAGYADYEWFGNGMMISNQATIDATVPGVYYVVVTNEFGCQAISAEISITGVDDFPEDIFFIYPNPASDFVFVRAKNIIEVIKLTDYQGRVVRTLRPNHKESSIEIQDLASGVYGLQMNFANGQITSKLVVKQ